MASKAKILFIGIDSADKDLIVEWANAGYLPTFKTLLDKFAWGNTSCPVGFYVGSLWPSFATGVSAAEHGRYCFSQLTKGTYQTYRYDIFDLQGEMFWDTFSRAGRRVAVIDVPLTPPLENLNGIQITDWGVHKANHKDIFYTWPSSLSPEIEAEFGRDSIRRCNNIKRTVNGFQDFQQKMIERTHKKERLSKKFLDQGNWDLFLTTFTEPHCIGHQCWHIHDLKHPNHDHKLANILGDPILEVYKALDGSIGRLIAEVGAESNIFVYCSHGMGSQDGAGSFLPWILGRLENSGSSTTETVRKPATTEIVRKPAYQKKLSKILAYLGKPKLFLWRLRKIFQPDLDPPLTDFAVQTLNVSGRKCFMLGNNDACGAVRVNLVGREPDGKVNPGAEYEEFCQQLTKDLLEIIDDTTGQPLVKNIIRASDAYQGTHLDELPDLIIEWNRQTFIPSISSPKIGKLENTYSGVRTGDHKPSGIFFAMGPNVKPGKIAEETSVLDFAPTLAQLLDVNLSNAEGKVIDRIANLNREHLQTN
ncbi:MAG: alkaline phosphatase family protein [Aphanocapsa sp. GSE-SYN-MK-11-07L]|jgi:predicted AlkP superfamily phosphohydrolase/phosphomutase|nr:alkaline phosphatase family protein [Aphanocapsa sp. GSE-SYN-MK-11-07L]